MPHPLGPITHPSLALAGIRHGFFTREGGVSSGIYASLNCGTGSRDDRAAVLENRARVAGSLGLTPDRIASPYQVHGDATVVVDEPWAPGEGPKADGLASTTPGVAIAIGTADCGPILFADGEARVVGAAHAGWRGALGGILESTIRAMEGLGARRARIVAVLGPSISQRNYEVGPELVEKFVAAGAANARFFTPSPRPGHSLFDLPGYTVARLRAAGVQAEGVGLCTYADPARFFSYRRATHLGEPDYGRLISAIALQPDVTRT
jgi:YfiH family protein